MKTNQLKYNRVRILFSLTALLFCPFTNKAQLKVDALGNVGIGIGAMDPLAQLHLGGAAPVINMGTFAIASEFGSDFRIWDYNAGANRLYINTSGNIGIGTSAPGAKLSFKDVGVSTTADGLTWYNPTPLSYGIYRTAGTWVGNNYQQLQLNWLTGIILNPGVSYGKSYVDIQGGGLRVTSGSVGIGTTTPGTYKLYVIGTSYFNGNGNYTGSWSPSDQQFKTNIDSISNALSLIHQLKPRSFYFDTTNVYGLNFSNLKQYGLIAQDVEQLLPELVTATTKPADIDTLGNIVHPAVTYKSLNYTAFIGIMVQGIKEQSIKIDSLSEGLLTEKTKTNTQDSIITSLQNQMNQSITKYTSLQNQLNALAETINSCCNDNHDNGNHNGGHRSTIGNQTSVELNDEQSIVLEQNVPNPFAEQTSINYSLPDNTIKAQMLFYNSQGKLIQSIELTQKGKGTLNVFASDLSSGIYTYTLVVDGKIIETKKMVKQ